MHWGSLRVWNNDRIAPNWLPAASAPGHGDRDHVIKGAITHQDHLGNQGRTEAGQIQVMSAGQGIPQHAEYNRESDETELFQIWILPNKGRRAGALETVQFPADDRDGKLVPLASGRGHDNAIRYTPTGALCRKR